MHRNQGALSVHLWCTGFRVHCRCVFGAPWFRVHCRCVFNAPWFPGCTEGAPTMHRNQGAPKTHRAMHRNQGAPKTVTMHRNQGAPWFRTALSVPGCTKDALFGASMVHPGFGALSVTHRCTLVSVHCRCVRCTLVSDALSVRLWCTEVSVHCTASSVHPGFAPHCTKRQGAPDALSMRLRCTLVSGAPKVRLRCNARCRCVFEDAPTMHRNFGTPKTRCIVGASSVHPGFAKHCRCVFRCTLVSVHCWCVFGASSVYPGFGALSVRLRCTLVSVHCSVRLWCTLVHRWCTFGASSVYPGFGALSVRLRCTLVSMHCRCVFGAPWFAVHCRCVFGAPWFRRIVGASSVHPGFGALLVRLRCTLVSVQGAPSAP